MQSKGNNRAVLWQSYGTVIAVLVPYKGGDMAVLWQVKGSNRTIKPRLVAEEICILYCIFCSDFLNRKRHVIRNPFLLYKENYSFNVLQILPFKEIFTSLLTLTLCTD